jgi:hypothetical protein
MFVEKIHTIYGYLSAFVAASSSVGRRAGSATSRKLLSQLTLSGHDVASPKPRVVGSSPSAPAKKKAIRASGWLFSVKFACGE